VNKGELRNVVRMLLHPFYCCPEAKLTSFSWESKNAFRMRRQCEFQSNQNRALDRLINALETQWPCEILANSISHSSVEFRNYIDIGRAVKEGKPKFKTWFDNYPFCEYPGQIEDTLRGRMVSPVGIPSYSFAIPSWNV